MNLAQMAVYLPIRILSRILFRIHDEELPKIPAKGPMILVANHVNFADVPIFYTHLLPRPVTGFSKAENWNNPALGFLFSLGGAIPVRRGAVDRPAIVGALEVLRSGRILAIAPEGTRSGDGRLQRGHSGIAVLALDSGAPVWPVAYWGGEKFWHNLTRFRRTDFFFRVGAPFTVQAGDERPTRAVREQITQEIMYRIAALLPPEYRGYYSDLSLATSQYLAAAE